MPPFFSKGFCTDEIIDDLIVEKSLSQEWVIAKPGFFSKGKQGDQAGGAAAPPTPTTETEL